MQGTQLYAAAFYDQRGPGFTRVVNGRIDIGSFEVQTPMRTLSLTPMKGVNGEF